MRAALDSVFSSRWARWRVGVFALLAIAVALWRLESATDGLAVTEVDVDGTPATIFRPAAAAAGPAVVIAHGFAGSRQLMAPFATTLAQNGYTAIAFDFLGHGDNAQPLGGDVTKVEGATRALVAETVKLLAYARRPEVSDGRVALLGHSMASDIVVRAAIADGSVAATVAVSMFSEAVDAAQPKNLLIIVGSLEGFLAEEALRATALVGGEGVVEGETYGSFAEGSARRAVLSDGVEHVGVLYSRESLSAARDWLNRVFERESDGALDARGPAILLLIVGVAALAWPLARLLPRVRDASADAAIEWRRGILLAAGPAIATPLLLAWAPTDFLPILVADYLAIHFLVYGALTLLGLAALGRARFAPPTPAFAAATAAATLFGIGAIGAALDAYVANFTPHAGRVGIIAMLAVGCALYAVADAQLGWRAPLWFRVFTKLCFLGSLILAIALNLEDLFFLAIIFPVIVLFFLLYGLIGRWVANATGAPSVAALANGFAIAWALGVTFPLLAG